MRSCVTGLILIRVGAGPVRKIGGLAVVILVVPESVSISSGKGPQLLTKLSSL